MKTSETINLPIHLLTKGMVNITSNGTRWIIKKIYKTSRQNYTINWYSFDPYTCHEITKKHSNKETFNILKT